MNKNKLSTWQFATLITFPILSFYNAITSYNITKYANQNSYLSIIISFFLSLILLYCFYTILTYKKELTITQKNKYIFGSLIGTIINIIININIFLIGTILFYLLNNFIILEYLDKTSITILMIILGLLLIYNNSKGIINIARTSVIFFIIIILLNLIEIIGLTPIFNFSNLLPILDNRKLPIIKGSINILLTNITPIFTLLIMNYSSISPTKKLKKRILTLYTISFLFILIENILTTGTLGIYLTKIYQHPEYIALQQISILNFIERIENFIYIKWILSCIITLSIIINHINLSINKHNKLHINIAIVTLMIFTSNIIFKTNTYLYTIANHILTPISIIQFLLYLFITINIIKKRIN